MTMQRSWVLLALMGAAAAQAQDMPQRKPGLWEMTMTLKGQPGAMPGSQQCVDARTDADLQRKGMSGDGRERCTMKTMKRTADGFEMHSECTGPEGRSTVVARGSGDFQTRYQVATQVVFDPPRHGMKQAEMNIAARHAGACPAGMKPGDVRVAGMSMPAGGAPGQAPGLPPGLPPEALKGMSPEQMRQLAEQLKKAQGK